LTQYQLLLARNWIKDCCPWREILDPEEVDDLTDAEVIAGIQKHFSGGIEGFKLTLQ